MSTVVSPAVLVLSNYADTDAGHRCLTSDNWTYLLLIIIIMSVINLQERFQAVWAFPVVLLRVINAYRINKCRVKCRFTLTGVLKYWCILFII